MPVLKDKQMQIMVRREMNRRQLDTSDLDIYVYRGVVYLRGTLRAIRGSGRAASDEIGIILRVLRMKEGVRDVVNECRLR